MKTTGGQAFGGPGKNHVMLKTPTDEIEPRINVARVLARTTSARSPVEIAERLGRLVWWDRSLERLAEALPDIRSLDVAAFLERHEGRAR